MYTIVRYTQSYNDFKISRIYIQCNTQENRLDYTELNGPTYSVIKRSVTDFTENGATTASVISASLVRDRGRVPLFVAHARVPTNSRDYRY